MIKMIKIKNFLFIYFIIFSVIIIVLNTFFLNFFNGKMISEYIFSNYQNNVESLKTYSEEIIKNKVYGEIDIDINLRRFLDEPITAVYLYDGNNNLIGFAEDKNVMMKMHGRNEKSFESTEVYDIKDDEKTIGKIILKTDTIPGNLSEMLVKPVLKNTFFSFLIAVSVAFIISFILGSITSKDLKKTSDLASQIELENSNEKIKKSRIKEIRNIQDIIIDLSKKLKFKEFKRKNKLDIIIHNVKTPLTILQNNVEAVADKVIEPDEEFSDTCINQINIINETVKNIPDIFEIKEDSINIKKEKFSANTQIKKITDALKYQFNKKGIKLIFENDEDIIINTDKEMFTEIVYNLVSNAYKYTEKGYVKISLKKSAEKIYLTVKDSGIGINPDETEKIKNPYYRGKNSFGIKGEGLGLYIVSRNTQIMEGKFEIKSSEKQGSEFEIILPAK